MRWFHSYKPWFAFSVLLSLLSRVHLLFAHTHSFYLDLEYIEKICNKRYLFCCRFVGPPLARQTHIYVCVAVVPYDIGISQMQMFSFVANFCVAKLALIPKEITKCVTLKWYILFTVTLYTSNARISFFRTHKWVRRSKPMKHFCVDVVCLKFSPSAFDRSFVRRSHHSRSECVMIFMCVWLFWLYYKLMKPLLYPIPCHPIFIYFLRSFTYSYQVYGI